MSDVHERIRRLGLLDPTDADYQAVRVRHPLASLTVEQARVRGDEALADVIAVLTGHPIGP